MRKEGRKMIGEDVKGSVEIVGIVTGQKEGR